MADWLLVSGQGPAFIPALYQKRQISRFQVAGHVNFRDLVFRVKAGRDCWETSGHPRNRGQGARREVLVG